MSQEQNFPQYVYTLPDDSITRVVVYYYASTPETQAFLEKMTTPERQDIAIQIQIENATTGNERTGLPERTWWIGTFMIPPLHIRYHITYTPDITKRPPPTDPLTR